MLVTSVSQVLTRALFYVFGMGKCSLPNEVVEPDTVNAFKNRLDKHWSNQGVLFDFNADLTGTGSVPVCM